MTVERSLLDTVTPVDDFRDFGIRAFTTTRATGSFATASDEAVRDTLGRWGALRAALGAGGARFATALQVHGADLVVHRDGWTGWLRGDAADGHVSPAGDVAMAVTIADCTPVFIAHPSGAMAVLHAGWRGAAAGILAAGVGALARTGFAPADLRIHLGPSICGRCYEVGPEVHAALTGERVAGPAPIDVRAALREQARHLGVEAVTVSDECTRCTDGRYFSHRAGDAGRLVAVIARDG